MARKQKHEEHVNHERWLVSYADFITLLFAFFVVMYSISSINEGKYRVLSNVLVKAFSQPERAAEPIQQGTPLSAPIVQHRYLNTNLGDKKREGVDHQIVPSQKEIAEMQKIEDEVEKKLQDLVDEEIVNLHKTTKGLEIEIKSSILFKSGSAALQLRARKVLNDVATVLEKIPNDINVEGFTDNIPIRTSQFPSNWELSAARAASVVHIFSQSGLAPDRLAAIGYGEFRPVADNSTEKGRSDNRRVAIVVLKDISKRRQRLLNAKKAKATEKIKTPSTDSRPNTSSSDSSEEKQKSIAPVIINLRRDQIKSPLKLDMPGGARVNPATEAQPATTAEEGQSSQNTDAPPKIPSKPLLLPSRPRRSN